MGGIERIVGRLMVGWVTPATSSARLGLELMADGQPLGGTVAEPPPGSRDGRLVFEFMLPLRLLDGLAHEMTARSAEGEVALENNIHVLSVPGALEVTGWLEKVSPDGRVLGWAWYPERPDTRVEVELLVDGVVAGSATAGLFRADVAEAGAGDGRYGFSWPLPFSVLQTARDVTISARDRASGHELPQPVVFRQKPVTDALARMDELENDIKLLQGTIAALNARHASETAGSAELLEIVSGFFNDQAAASATGASLSGLRGVQAAVTDVTASFEPFVFAPYAAPQISVFVEAGVDLATTYASLRALQETMGGAPVEVFLLDDGKCQDAALLALVAQNLRYMRLPGGHVARRNAALRLARGVAMFLVAGVAPEAGWANALRAFAGQATTQVMFARLRDADGTLQTPEGVDGLGDAMFALRRTAWEVQGGFDEAYAGGAAALAAFCRRAGAGALGVGPTFAGVVQAASFMRDAEAVGPS